MKPGHHIKTFTSKSGKEILLRYPTMKDISPLLEYINELSREDTYITYSGQQLTIEEETKFVQDVIQKMHLKDQVMLLAFHGNTLVGNTSVERDKSSKRRSEHIGTFGISLHKAYRNDGIGKILAQTVIKIATETMKISMITLDVYAINTHARNLYTSLGFIEYGTLPAGVEYKHALVDKIMMYKKV